MLSQRSSHLLDFEEEINRLKKARKDCLPKFCIVSPVFKCSFE